MDNSGDVVSLQDLCLLTVGNYLSHSNVWSIYRLVPYVHCRRIEYIVHSFICDHFMDISHTDQFLVLDEKEMQWLVDNHDIVASEAAMLDGLARWYKHSEHQRESAFKQLFDRLHVNVIGKDVLWEVIKKYELHKVIPDLLKYKVSKFLPRRLNLHKLIHDENLLNIVVITQTFFASQIAVWIPFASNFYITQSLEELRIKPVLDYVIPLRDKVFALGMIDKGDRDYVPVNIRIDLQTQALTYCTPLNKVLGTFSEERPLAVTCGIYIYFLGGRDVEKGHEFTNTVFRYDTVKDEWREMAHTHNCPFPANSYSTFSTVLAYKNRYLYLFGAQVYGEKYDMYTNTWTPLVPPWEYCNLISAFTMKDKIYVVLRSLSSHVFVFDPLSETWQEMSLPNEGLRFYCCPTGFYGECFGELFSLFDGNKTAGHHLSAVDKHLREKKTKLYSFSASTLWRQPKIGILNRRARVHLVQQFKDQCPRRSWHEKT